MESEKTLRAFLAIELPAEILREIGRFQGQLQRLVHGEVRWTRTEGIHLTLKFFGSIAEEAVPAISAVVEEVAAAATPFSLAVGGIGAFPDQRRPRVLWVGLSGDVERLAGFQRNLEEALIALDFAVEERSFAPHLTLARIRSPKDLTGLPKALEKGEHFAAGSFVAPGIGLIKSELKPQGAVYTRLKWFPFAGGK
jgi:2'-5' RNA ligase